MKAAVLTQLNSPLSIENVFPPDRLSYGQVLVQIIASGICGAQLQEIAGLKGNSDHIPHLLGHEGCGRVVGVGVGVTRVKIGDKVVLHWRCGRGIESDFPSYTRKDGEFFRSGKITTFSEFSVVSENRCTPVPDSAPTQLCVLLGCSLSTALATVELEANVKFGESVLIIGCGGLGLNLIVACRLAAACPITVCDIFETKRAAAEKLGANVFVNTRTTRLDEMFDVVLDTSGDVTAIQMGINHLAPGGRMVMIGQPHPNAAVVMQGARAMFDGSGKTIKATQGGGFNPSDDIPRYIKLADYGILETDLIVTHRLGLDQINRGIELVRHGEAGRIIIEM